MMRKYGMERGEFEGIMVNGNLPEGDPKVHLARETFNGPIDVNAACYEELIRVPGIGPQSAQRIIDVRDGGHTIKSRSQLKDIGVVLKRADKFIKVMGRTQTTIAGWG